MKYKVYLLLTIAFLLPSFSYAYSFSESSIQIVPKVTHGIVDLTTNGGQCGEALEHYYNVFQGTPTGSQLSDLVFWDLNECKTKLDLNVDLGSGYGPTDYYIYDYLNDTYFKFYWNGEKGFIYNLNGTLQDGSIRDIMDQANSNFQATTNFSITGVVGWAGDNLIKLFIGSGLGLLFDLRWWIMAMLIISSIVYFSYRSYQFFKH